MCRGRQRCQGSLIDSLIKGSLEIIILDTQLVDPLKSILSLETKEFGLRRVLF